jgi:hypothetical protein
MMPLQELHRAMTQLESSGSDVSMERMYRCQHGAFVSRFEGFARGPFLARAGTGAVEVLRQDGGREQTELKIRVSKIRVDGHAAA